MRREDGNGRAAAIEILLNTPTIAEHIFKGDFHEIKGIMTKSRELGMRTFDWALFELYNAGLISFDEAMRNADSANELRLNIKLKSERGEPEASAFMSLALEPEQLTPEQIEEQRAKELQQQAQTRKRLEDEQVRERLLGNAAAAASAGGVKVR